MRKLNCVDLSIDLVRLYDFSELEHTAYPLPFTYVFKASTEDPFKDIPGIQRVEEIAWFEYCQFYYTCYTGQLYRIGKKHSLYVFSFTDSEEVREIDKRPLREILKKFVVYENLIPVAQFEVAPYNYITILKPNQVGDLIASLINNGWKVVFR